MKRKKLIPIIAVFVLLIILFVPVSKGTLQDGGTRDYVALTYRVVDWNKIMANGVYEKTRVYWLGDKSKTIDELWQMEQARIEKTFLATVISISDDTALVEPYESEVEKLSCDSITFGTASLPNIYARPGSSVEITYVGPIMESYPAQINAISWKIKDTLRDVEYAKS